MFYEKADVVIVKNKNESKAVLEGLNLLSQDPIIKNEDIVVLVPNWVNAVKPNPRDGVVVGNETLRTIIRYVKSFHPKEFVIASGSGGGDTKEVMKKVGYDVVLQEEQVPFIDFNEGPYDELMINGSVIKKLKINTIIHRMTKLISFTQLKQHEEATMSGTIKNVMMSIPSTEEHGTPKKDTGIHDDLHNFLYSMAKQIRIDVSIISAQPAMVGKGPTNGAAFHTDLVIVSNNPISADTIGARLLGFKPQGVHYLYLLEKEGFKETDIQKMKLQGVSLEEAEKIFSKAVYGQALTIE